ncbi:MAG TPA: CARDB domain-containing protein [Thermoclostridium sp.]|nr:CARDB domain-containing protein [Thermoclostridium sp.]
MKQVLKKISNLTLALIFVLVTMISILPPDVAMAADLDVSLVSNRKSLRYNYGFEIEITITNNTGREYSDLLIDLTGAANIAVPDDNMPTEVEVVPGTDGTAKKTIKMIFVGDGSSRLLPATIKYTFVGDIDFNSITKNFTLDVDTQGGNEPNPPTDTTIYKPNIEVSVADNATVMAGQYTGLDVTLKNTSVSTSAGNIVFTPVYESGSPFTHVKTLSDMPIRDLRPNDSQTLKLSVNTYKFANPGLYPFRFKLTYKNPWGDEFSSEHIVYINVANNNLNARLTVRTSSADNVSAVAGKSFTVPVYVSNTGDFYAKDILITLQGLSQDTFILSSGSNRVSFDRINGRDFKKFDLNLVAAKGLKTASYPLSFSVEYTTEAGEKISEKQEIWIPVTGSGDAVSSLEILEVKTSKTTVTTSDIFDVSVTIKNAGTVNAEQVKVSADGTSALLPVSQNLFILSKLTPGETRTLTFKYQPSPDAQRGSVPIVIRVESLDGSNTMISQAVSVFVDADKGSTDPSKNVPKIIVGSYSYEPQQVKAGERFTLYMSFRNTHSSKTIRNIKGSFNVEEKSNETGNVFTPVDSSNTFFIDEIRPRDSYDWAVNLYTIPDALSKTYTVIISFEYEDEYGNPYTAQEIIGIPVYQPSRFEVSEISLPSEVYMGQPVYISFSLYNMGKTDLYNVKMSVQGDFAADPMSNYFGNFTPGYMEWCEINLIPMQPGMGMGKIVVEYETTSGEIMTYEKEFAMNVLEMPAYDPGFPVDGPFPMDPGMEPGNEGGGFFSSVWFYIILGVVVAAGIAITIIAVRKRKKNKEFEF